jgi:probable phosphoglycerate mutase
LKGLGIERVLSSDLTRCVQTIEPLVASNGLALELRPDLRERTFGTMEGKDYSELHVWMREEGRRLEIPDWQVRPPGGESMADVWRRLDDVEAELRAETRTTLVVSHGGALAQLLAKLIKGSAETPRAFRFSNCSVTVLTRRPDRSLMLERFNDCTHLEELVETAAQA